MPLARALPARIPAPRVRACPCARCSRIRRRLGVTGPTAPAKARLCGPAVARNRSTCYYGVQAHTAFCTIREPAAHATTEKTEMTDAWPGSALAGSRAEQEFPTLTPAQQRRV